VPLAQGALAVSVFGRDDLSAPVLAQLWAHGVRSVLLRSVGTDNVDLPAAHRLGLRVANVPDYSPHAIAEHAVALPRPRLLLRNRPSCSWCALSPRVLRPRR
jgi:D-lactate dehydrogenase